MTVCGFRSVCGWLLRYFSVVGIFMCVFETYYDTDETFLLCFCSEGVFKCPEDQLPLDYAKVQFLRLC